MLPYHTEFLVPLLQEERRRDATRRRFVKAALAARRRPIRFAMALKAFHAWLRRRGRKTEKRQTATAQKVH